MNQVISKSTAVKAKPETQRHFIGRAWFSKSQAGKEYINIKLDQTTKLVDVGPECVMQLWANTKKRADKKDPDYNLSILVPVGQAQP